MKRISVVIPCYNEENCVDEMYQRLTAVFAAEPEYDYEIIYVDDCSRDKTRERIELLCRQDKRVRAEKNRSSLQNAGVHVKPACYGHKVNGEQLRICQEMEKEIVQFEQKL